VQLVAYNGTLYPSGMDDEITIQECCDLYEEITGRRIKPVTWRAYVHRKQAPQPKRHVGATPVWDRAVVVAHLKSRPRVGPAE
jgi:hypothetical protein